MSRAKKKADAIPSAEERKGKRGHDERGNVRPADGRWDLHDPAEESEVVRTPDEK